MFSLKQKGFTIVELVIVIAVIAILAAVLIPTFTIIIKNAEVSTAFQACKSASSLYLLQEMKKDPTKTAKQIFEDIYFAYDSDGDGIEVGEYKFFYIKPNYDQMVTSVPQYTVGATERWYQIPDTSVYHKK